MIEAVLDFLGPSLPYLILTSIVWITYCYTLKCTFVSDDLQGILEYDGKLQGKEYGMISRWIRYHLAGGSFPSKQKDRSGNFIPQGKIPVRHHILSILIFNIAILLGYYFLSNLIGQNLALMSLSLFVVHPVGTQAIAWCSGIGYPLCLFWCFSILSLLQWFHSIPHGLPYTAVAIGVFCLLYALCVNALFVGLGLWVVLLFLGYNVFAAIGLIISIITGLQIVRSTIKMRADEFKKQEMGHSTFLKPRKFIVAVKTLWYYLKLTFWPVRMGLYHTWGYHYSADLEREDGEFFIGILCIIALGIMFFLFPIPVKFGIIWFISLIFIMLNWITIQQFVTERYLFIPVLGLCIIASYFLQELLPVYMLVFGIAICRTWLHLPTYDNELRFYQSNIWNFNKSETAYGNLGVTYLRYGYVGSALDAWHMAIEANPDYDVPYYNIYSHYNSNAYLAINQGDYARGLELLKMGYPYLEKCVKAPICHFKNTWTEELKALKSIIDDPKKIVASEKIRLETLRKNLENRLVNNTNQEDINGIQKSLDDIKPRLEHISSILG